MRNLSSKLIPVLISCFWLSIVSVSHAEDFYVAQSALGSNSGTDAADAYGESFFNSAANWSSPTKVVGLIGPGDTVHLVGIITNALTVQASGTPGNVITILFEPGADMSVPVWSSSGAIVLFQDNYITIDGGGNGIIENTANGSNLANKIPSNGIVATECSNVTVQNITIQNLYVRVKGSEQSVSSAGVVFRWNGGISFSNDVVNNCTFHDMTIGASMDYGPGCSNFTVSNCTAFNCNWGGNAGDHSNTSTLNGLVIHDNKFYNWDNWTDTSSNNSFHHNGFYGWSEQLGGTARLTNVSAFNNTVGPGFNGTASTSGLFFSGNVGNLLVYNNIFTEAAVSDNPADGLIAIWIHDGNQTGYGVYNNTIVGAGNGVGIWFYQGNGSGATTYIAKNNIITGVATAISQFLNGSATLVSDFNNVSGLQAGEEFNTSSTSSSAFKTLSQWNALGFDTHSTTVTPLFVASGSGNYQLALTDMAAVDNGADLSAFFTVDKNGVSRPQGPSWDIGCYEQIPTSPVVTTQPIPSPIIMTGSNITLSITARGAPTLTYQWQLNGMNLSDGGEISGSTTPSLTLTGATTLDSGNYTVVVSNGITPPATSTISALVVGTIPLFTTQPAVSQSLATGSNTTLTVATTGIPTPTYQWQENGVNISNSSVVSGVTSNTLTLTDITGVDAGIYTVVATNAVGSTTSNAGTLAVTGSSAPLITLQPVGQTVNQGAVVTLTAIDAGTPAPSLQWYRGGTALSNGGVVSGAQTTTLTLTGVTPSNNGIYTLVASNGVGSAATSTGAQLTVTPATVAPTIAINPSSDTVGPGATVIFMASATGTPAPSYQWQKNGNNLSDGGDISGSTTSTLTISAVSLANNGTYTLVASNGIGSPAVSTGAVLTVTGIAPSIIQQPASKTVLSGSTVTLAVGATATPPASYQWQKNGVNITDGGGVSGSSSSTLTLTGVTTAMAGTYSVVISNNIGSPVTSMGAVLTVLIPSRLVNVSIRANSGPGAQTLIAGFVVSGGSKSVLIRGIGPGLSTFGISDFLTDPKLSLYNGPTLMQSNDGWGGTAALSTLFSQVGAFALSPTSLDSALATTVPVGAFTAQVSGQNGGIALAEIFDADTAEAPAGHFINVSARAQVGTGASVLIAGFVVNGDTSEQVLIRAIGPGLSTFGLTGVLSAPQLSLYDSNGNLIQANSSWGGTAALETAFAETGAFSLASNSLDAALLTTLKAGAYTAIVSGGDSLTGVALVEIYEIP